MSNISDFIHYQRNLFFPLTLLKRYRFMWIEGFNIWYIFISVWIRGSGNLSPWNFPGSCIFSAFNLFMVWKLCIFGTFQGSDPRSLNLTQAVLIIYYQITQIMWQTKEFWRIVAVKKGNRMSNFVNCCEDMITHQWSATICSPGSKILRQWLHLLPEEKSSYKMYTLKCSIFSTSKIKRKMLLPCFFKIFFLIDFDSFSMGKFLLANSSRDVSIWRSNLRSLMWASPFLQYLVRSKTMDPSRSVITN